MILQQTALNGEYLNLFLIGVTGMVLLSLALIAFFVIYQRRIFGQERLREMEKLRHQQALLQAAVEVQESERRRIARDLHDDIGSLLTATRLYLRQLSAEDEGKRIEMIRDKSLNILDEMIQNARQITHDLLPPALEKFGFQAAAEDLCDRISDGRNVRVVFEDGSPPARLSKSRELALYRVLQELITNTIKHAEATTITLMLGKKANRFTFHYQDDGKGYALKDTGSGLGLKNIESRVSIANGHLDFKTAPGAGVTVHISLPSERPKSFSVQ